ncbi:MAG: TrmB family transcriptional regulator [Candidatus Bathyarchaeia archaeon]|jgi:sugar-specific transcriptional regulator TrmB
MDLQNQIETLTQLGLTVNQAKIFIMLVRSEPSTVTQIAKATNLAREVVYKNIPKLEKNGLITKVIAAPCEYKAISINLASKILLEKRNKETFEVKTKVAELVSQMQKRNSEESKIEPHLIAVTGKEHLTSFAKKQVLTTKKSLETMILYSKYSFWLDTNFSLFRKLLARNVKIRIILASCTEVIHDKNIELLEKNPNFKIRYIPDPIQVGVGIIDDRDTLINTLPNNIFRPSFYWSNNPGVIALSKNYFEKFWNLTESTPKKSIKCNYT